MPDDADWLPVNLPRDVRMRVRHDGVQYRLPPVPFRPLRLIGLLPLGVSVPFVSFGAGTAWRSMLHTPGGAGDIFAAVFGTVFLATGLVPIAIGLYLLFGSIRLRLRPGRLERSYCLGPFGRHRAFDVAGISALRISTGPSRGEQSRAAATFSDLATLTIVRDGPDGVEGGEPARQEQIMTMLFPRQWIETIARDLARRIDQQQLSGAMADAPTRVEINEHTTLGTLSTSHRDGRDHPTPHARPVGSEIVVERERDHFTIVIPPAGLWKGSAGLFFFSLLWCGFMAVFSAVTVIIPLINGSFGGGVVPFLLFSLAFWSVGIGLLLAAINMGRRRAIIDVVDGTLLINRANLFGVRQHQWSRDEIDRLLVGPSGMEVNDKPVMELQVYPRGGKQIGLFSGRDEDELDWLAWQLSAALGLGEPTPCGEGESPRDPEHAELSGRAAQR